MGEIIVSRSSCSKFMIINLIQKRIQSIIMVFIGVYWHGVPTLTFMRFLYKHISFKSVFYGVNIKDVNLHSSAFLEQLTKVICLTLMLFNINDINITNSIETIEIALSSKSTLLTGVVIVIRECF